jgi:hypothetical protein
VPALKYIVIKLNKRIPNRTSMATTSDLLISNDINATDAIAISTTNGDADNLPATRKRKARRHAGFVQTDDFIPKRKQRMKSTGKKEIEEEFATTWICVECKEAECMMEPEGSELLICDGVCRRVFHYPCAGLSQIPPDDVPFICDDCTNQKHVCTLCSNYGYDNEDIYKCSKSTCGLFYHESCLSMRNIEVRLIRKNHENGIDEVLEHNSMNDHDDEVDDNEELRTKKKLAMSLLERRFVCPAHLCWTCTQLDLKDEVQQSDVIDTKSTAKKTKKRTSGVFEAKKEKFLTVRLCKLGTEGFQSEDHFHFHITVPTTDFILAILMKFTLAMFGMSNCVSLHMHTSISEFS